MSGELPDTSDPFELLGIERSVDERELKRAYARLIRKHRPERDPGAFQRIHAAYEEARRMVQWGVVLPVGASSETEAETETETEAETETETESDAETETAAELDREDVLLLLLDGVRLGGELFDILPERELRELAADERLSWNVLRRQPPWLAANLFDARVAQLLWLDQVDQVIAELLERQLQDDMVGNPDLEWTFRRALTAICWSDLDAADELHELFAHDTIDASYVGARYEDLRIWAPLPPKLPRELERFISLSDVVSYGMQLELTRNLCEVATKHPSAILHGLDILNYHRSGLLAYLGYADSFDEPDEDEDEDEAEDEDKESERDYRAVLDDELAMTLREMSAVRGAGKLAVIAGLSLPLLGYLFSREHYTLALVLTAAATVATVLELTKRDAEAGYHTLLRPALARIIGLEGVRLREIRAYCAEHRKLRKYVAELDCDIELHTLAALRERLRDQDEAETD